MTSEPLDPAVTYRLDDEPRHVLDAEDAPLPGHYEADFVTPDGGRVRRYLTDKGRTTVLRILAEGTHGFSVDDLRRHTVEPDLDQLVARMAAEAGEGA
jgi:hypothetical protein